MRGLCLCVVLGALATFGASAGTNAQDGAGSNLTTVTLLSTAFNPPSVQSFWYAGAIDGLYKAHGLDVHPQQSPGSPASIAAIMSGKAQFASVNLNTFASAAAEGLPAKGVMLGNFDTPGVVLAQAEIASAGDLATKTIATSSLGSQEYTIVSSYLRIKGIDTSKIQWVATNGNANSLQALLAHRVDAAWFDMTTALKALEMDPKLKILVSPEQLSQTTPIGTGLVVVTNAYAAAHPDIVENFVAASIESCRKLVEDKSYFSATAEKWLRGLYRPQQLDELYEAYRPAYGVNGGMIMPVLEASLDEWKRTINPDRAKNPYFSTIDQIVDTHFAAAALKKLGIMPGSRDTADWLK
ncbi:MAG TPA: ABC transporter substrate-binding protein [Beijerinckiaceae bacterium]|nr:ABC transporter substrate-binding protein [Beijerinckiaceae bacterium]